MSDTARLMNLTRTETSVRLCDPDGSTMVCPSVENARSLAQPGDTILALTSTGGVTTHVQRLEI